MNVLLSATRTPLPSKIEAIPELAVNRFWPDRTRNLWAWNQVPIGIKVLEIKRAVKLLHNQDGNELTHLSSRTIVRRNSPG